MRTVWLIAVWSGFAALVAVLYGVWLSPDVATYVRIRENSGAEMAMYWLMNRGGEQKPFDTFSWHFSVFAGLSMFALLVALALVYLPRSGRR